MRNHRLCLVAAAFLTVALPVNAGESMTMAVSPLQSFSPTNLRVQIRVEPNVDNRLLEVAADSPEFYSSSQLQLDGDRAPKTLVVEFRSVPSGEYKVSVVLLNSLGRQRATARQQAVVLPSVRER